MTRDTYETADGRVMKLWVIVENSSKGGFPDKFLRSLISKAKANPEIREGIRRTKRTRIIVTPQVFRAFQSDIDIMRDTAVTLVFENIDDPNDSVVPKSQVAIARGMKETRMKAIPVDGRDGSRYDEFMRVIYR